jgi:acyl carrier protein
VGELARHGEQQPLLGHALTAMHPGDSAHGPSVRTALGARLAVRGVFATRRIATIPAVETEIRQFLAEVFFLGDDPADVPGSKSLIDSGIVDSTGVLEIVGFLEERYSIRIDDEELVPENLDSIDNIVAFVGRKLAVPA